MLSRKAKAGSAGHDQTALRAAGLSSKQLHFIVGQIIRYTLAGRRGDCFVTLRLVLEHSERMTDCYMFFANKGITMIPAIILVSSSFLMLP